MMNPQVGHTPTPIFRQIVIKKLQTKNLKLTCTWNKNVKQSCHFSKTIYLSKYEEMELLLSQI
jgi:hypothetical protein